MNNNISHFDMFYMYKVIEKYFLLSDFFRMGLCMKNNSIAKNTFYSIVKSCTQVLYPLITFPYISRVLLTENVGKINFGNSIVSYFSLIASLGVSSYAVRECSRVRDSRELLEKTASQILSINLITTFFSYILLTVTLLFAKPLVNYRILIVMQSFVIICTTLGADWLNTAMEDFEYITIRTVLFQFLSLIAMFIFVRNSGDYLNYVMISVLASSGANISNIFYRRKYCKMSFTIQMNVMKHMPHILLLFAMVLFQVIYCNSDITILGLLCGDYEVGLYSTSVKIYNIVKSLITSITLVVIPKLSYYFSANNYMEVNKLLNYAFSCMVTLGVPCIIGVNLIAPEIIEIMAGPEYLGAVSSLRILTIAFAFALMGAFFGNAILLPSVREMVFLKICGISAVVNVITNFIFIPSFGLNAAAATTAFSELIVFLGSYLQVEKEIYLGDAKELFLSPCIGGLGIIVVSVVFSYFVTQLWVKTILIIVFSIIVYVGILLIFKNKIALRVYKAFLKKIDWY